MFDFEFGFGLCVSRKTSAAAKSLSHPHNHLGVRRGSPLTASEAVGPCGGANYNPAFGKWRQGESGIQGRPGLWETVQREKMVGRGRKENESK